VRGTAPPTSENHTVSHPERIAGTVYGTTIVLAAIAVGTDERNPWRLALLVTSSTLAIWLAHVYAHALGDSIRDGIRINRERLRRVARRELSIPLSGVIPCLLLVAGALGLLRESAAVWLAIGAGLVTLGVQGARYARIESANGAAGLVIIAVNILIGIGIVLVKVFVLLFH